jgi:hypothetical protein
MSRGAVDLVVERLLVDGLDLTPEQAGELGRLLEEELRPIVAGGGPSALAADGITAVIPVSLKQPPDLRALARELAKQVAARAMRAGAGHG